MRDPRHWTERKPAVICLGLSALDYVWHVDTLPGPGGKVRAADFATRGGGMAATAAVAVARLGGRAYYWGRAGDDAEGLKMRDELAGAGVDVEQFRMFAGARSSVSGVVVDRAGERQIVNFRGAGLPTDPGWLPAHAAGAADAVLADPRWPEGAHALFNAARAARVPTILDADVADREVFERVLPLTDHAIFSEPGLAAFTSLAVEEALGRVRGYGCRVAAVTRGAHGILCLDDDGLRHHRAFRVDAVDTTGAGDVFHGAYAYALAAGAPLGDAIAFACAVAALKCTTPGGRAGIPSLSDTLRFWRAHT